MERPPASLSDKEYLEEITRFSEEYLAYETDRTILPGVHVARIGGHLGMGLHLEVDEIMAVWTAIENKRRLYIPGQNIPSQSRRIASDR